MRYILSTILVLSVFVFTGCLEQSSGNSIGGVMKSDDAGRTFESRVFIDEERSLARSSVVSLAVDPSNDHAIYAGTLSDDLYKSIDGADSWGYLTTNLQNITNIVINPFNTETLYVSGLYQGRGSVIKSVDGGVTWDRVYVEPADGTNITAMVVSPVNGDMVYIGTSGGTIARTNNGGDAWENLYHAMSSVNALAIDGGDINTLYALISGNDIVKSRDNGVTFESVRAMKREAVMKIYEGTLYSMTVSPSISGVIIVGTNRGVFRSNDYGLSWEPIDVIASTIGIPIHAIAVNPHDVNQLVYAAAKAVYTSVSDGWAITDTTSNRIVSVITHDPIDPNVVYIGLQNAK